MEELATNDFRTWLHELFGALVGAAGYPDKLAAQLVMFYDGANISAQMDHNPAVALAARDAAADLLRTAPKASRPKAKKRQDSMNVNRSALMTSA